ncbi:hypothetical protein DSCO28_63380 [Desulfosarcina ovata subsp. sediminis]|uniref:Uncharacterized protein n=1 Tax=Desulfosarcina ovata subsp. sediminis TaxID=885957 RepID=A0A5K7ZZT9_9BACT|nr:hypothetical protein [Desulfosarcina ovata]BBO85772.1 hypothetical protein DSCO28_63380 [Desulfosarcina ovata subsp. sediminis]
MDSNILSALIGAAAAMLFTNIREWYLLCRQRKNSASAFVFEFRVLKRKIQADLDAAEKHSVVVFDPPFSKVLHETLLNQLPGLGGHVFLCVKAVYAQLRQINYLKSRLQKVSDSGEPKQKDGLYEAYISACKQALDRIEDALAQLKPRSSFDSFAKDLPKITDLTEEERKWWPT